MCKEEGVKVIDSNNLADKKIEKWKELNAVKQRTMYDEGFKEGIEAQELELRLDENGNYIDDTNAQISDEEYVEQAQNILEQAKVGAEETIQQAREEAEAILEAARQEAEAIKQDAFAEGRDSGLQAGRQESDATIASMKTHYLTKQKELDHNYETAVEELESQLIENLTPIYEHVFSAKFSEQKAIILHLLQNAMHEIGGNRDFLIHVSKSDYSFVLEHKKDMVSGISSNYSVEIIEDGTLKDGDCFIETTNGIFDCSITTQLTELAKEIKALAFEKG